MVVAAAAMSLLSLYGISALADADAGGAAKGSPSAVSGSTTYTPTAAPGPHEAPHDDRQRQRPRS